MTTEAFAGAAVDIARIMATQNNRQRLEPVSRSQPRNGIAPLFTEEYLPEVTLDNHVTREVTESGTHVLITEHKEYLEKLKEPPVPLTPEEIAQNREDKKFFAKIWAGVASVGIVTLGLVVAVDRKKRE